MGKYQSSLYKVLLSLIALFCFSLLGCSEAQSKEDTDIKEIKSSAIIKKIKSGKPVQINNAIIWDDLDFSEVGDPYLMSGITMAVDVETPIYFRKCVFMGKINAKKKFKEGGTCITSFRRTVTFTECDFRDEVDFTKAQFEDNIDFSKSTFRSLARFDLARLRGETNRFHEIVAEQPLYMTSVYVDGTLTFMDAELRQDAKFQGINVAELIINNLKVIGKSEFSDMVVRGPLRANYADFGSSLNMSYATCQGTCSICHSQVEGDADLHNSMFFSTAKFNDSEMNDLNLSDVLFVFEPECDFLRVPRHDPTMRYYVMSCTERRLSSVVAEKYAREAKLRQEQLKEEEESLDPVLEESEQ